jgi:uncharacterized membrane protein
MSKLNVRKIALSAVVAALYTVLSYFAGIFGLAYGPIQCRFSEALCVLPFLFPETSWGLFIGCVLTNLMSSYGPVDIIFGSLATLLAAICTSKVKNRWLAPLPPVIANGVIVGATIAWFETGFTKAFWPAYAYNGITVAIGEAIACYVLGMLLLTYLPKISFFKKIIPEDRLKRIEK